MAVLSDKIVFGPASPVGVDCNGTQTSMREFPVYREGDIELLNKFIADDKLPNNPAEVERLKFLNEYFDIPRVAFELEPTDYLTIRRVLNSNNDALIRSMMGIFQMVKFKLDGWPCKLNLECFAAYNNDLSGIQKLRSLGYQIDYDVVHYAALGGHFDTFMWLYENVAPAFDDITKYAACGGNIEIVKFLMSKGIKFHNCQDAVSYGHLELVKYMHSRGVSIGNATLAQAITHGYTDFYQWAIEQGAVINAYAVDAAAKVNNMEIVQDLFARGVTGTVMACYWAIVHKNLPMLKYLRSKGCSWDIDITIEAIRYDNYEMLEYILEYGGVRNHLIYYEVKNAEMTRYLISKGIFWKAGDYPAEVQQVLDQHQNMRA